MTVRDTRATSHGIPPGSGSVIRVKLSDAATGLPLAGKIIAETYEPSGQYRTAAETTSSLEGNFELSALSPGGYRLKLIAEGYVTRVIEHSALGTNELKEFDTTLSRRAALNGIVLDENQRPAVKITTLQTMGPDGRGYPMTELPQAISDNEGHFQLSDLPIGSMQIRATCPGYHHLWRPSEVISVPNPPNSSVQVLHMGEGRTKSK